jgi:hypothetical protein
LGELKGRNEGVVNLKLILVKPFVALNQCEQQKNQQLNPKEQIMAVRGHSNYCGL